MSRVREPKAPAKVKHVPKPVPVVVPVAQVSQYTKRVAVMDSMKAAVTNPEFGNNKRDKGCLDGCMDRAIKAQKTKKKIDYRKMFG